MTLTATAAKPPPTPPTDSGALVERIRSGDHDAFADLVRLHGPRMLAVAARFLPDQQDRDDAVQDAFLSAFRSIGAFDGRSQLTTWLHRITVNACLMKLRARSRRPEASIDELLPRFDDTGHRVAPEAAWSDAIGRLEVKETRHLVRECIARLPEPYQMVLMLRDIEELDTAETARQLKCSEANVKTRLHRARQALRTLLAPHLT
jgi:RNA polymerase sigma-70 factor (ECF subfamily)